MDELDYVTDRNRCLAKTMKGEQCTLNPRPHHHTCIRHDKFDDGIKQHLNRKSVSGIHYMAHTVSENRVLFRCENKLYYLDVVTNKVYTSSTDKRPFGRYVNHIVVPY